MSSSNKKAATVELPPRVVAAYAFFDGIPSSVSAQFAQLVSMHAIAQLNSTNDHTRNGVVSSLATTLIGLLIAALGAALRHTVAWIAGLTEARPDVAPLGEEAVLRATYQDLLNNTSLDAIQKLNFTLNVNYGCTSETDPFSGTACKRLSYTVAFSCSAMVFNSSVELLHQSSATAEMFASFRCSPAVDPSNVPSVLQTGHATVRKTYAIVCLSRAQVRKAVMAASAAPEDTKTKADATFSAYMLDPVYLHAGSLYARTTESLNLVMFTVRTAWHAQSQAERDAAEAKDDDDKKLTIVDLLSAKAPSTPAAPHSTGAIQYSLSDSLTLGAQYRMESMFLESKTVLTNALDKFERDEMYPKGLAMTNKLGILMYGPPGTGKTNTIRAIANRLGRSLLRIDCSKFVEFDEDAFCRFVAKYTKSCVLELDEFDHVLAAMATQNAFAEARERRVREMRARCMMWGGGDGSESSSSSSDEGAAAAPATTDKEGTKKMTKKNKKKRGDKLLSKLTSFDGSSSKSGPRPMTASFLLRWLDGLGRDEGRVLIMCTNSPQLIHSDFIRPGRIDEKVYCGYCTPEMMAGLLGTKFPPGRGDAAVDLDWLHAEERFPALAARNITPLHFINTLSSADDIGTCMELLEEMPQLPDYPHKHIFESDAQRAAKIRAAAKREARMTAAQQQQKEEEEAACASPTTTGDGETSSSAGSTVGSE